MQTTTPDQPLVVVGFDGSSTGDAAVRWAAREAAASGARLRVVTAWDPSPINPWSMPYADEWRDSARKAAQQATERAQQIVGKHVHTESLVVEGAAGKVMIEQSHRADLLVVGSAGHVGLAGWFSGSVSRTCLHRASCPVVVVGPEAEPEKVRRLVLSSTLDPDAETLSWVDEWLDRRAVTIHVIASFDFTPDLGELQLTNVQRGVRDAVRDQNDVWVERLRDIVAGRAVITTELLEGQTIDVLASHTQPGDLIVVPSGCEHSVPFAHGSCPVAVVPAPGRELHDITIAAGRATASTAQAVR